MPYFSRTKEMDRVGFEPTTSAAFLAIPIYLMAGFLKENSTAIYHLFFERIHKNEPISVDAAEN
jgi:hypothetical protein